MTKNTEARKLLTRPPPRDFRFGQKYRAGQLTILRAVPATMFAFKAIPDWVALLDHPRMTHFEEYQLPKGIQNLSLSVTYYHDAQVNDYSWEYQGPTEAASNAKLMAIACNESRGDLM